MGQQLLLDKVERKDSKILLTVTSLIHEFVREGFIYASSGSRLLLSNFLFLIKNNDAVVGFITCVKDEKYLDGISTLDLCIKKEYRTKEYESRLNELLKDVVNYIKGRSSDFIIIDQRKSQVPVKIGEKLCSNSPLLLLTSTVEDFRQIYPKNINRQVKVVSYRSNYKNKKGKKRNKNGNNN